MSEIVEASLIALVRAALREAVAQEDTLVAALLTQCIETIEQRRRG